MFNENYQLTLAKAATSAGTSEALSAAIDTCGFEGCVFITTIQTANAGNYANIRQSSDNGVADAFADLLGTKVVGDKIIIDIYQPRERYLKCAVTRGASTVVGEIYAICYGPRKAAITQGSGVDAEAHVSPAEGTC